MKLTWQIDRLRDLSLFRKLSGITHIDNSGGASVKCLLNSGEISSWN